MNNGRWWSLAWPSNHHAWTLIPRLADQLRGQEIQVQRIIQPLFPFSLFICCLSEDLLRDVQEMYTWITTSNKTGLLPSLLCQFSWVWGWRGGVGSFLANAKVAFSRGSYNYRCQVGLKIFLCLFSLGLHPFSSSPTAHFFKLHSSWHMHYLLRMLNVHISQSTCLKMYSAASPPLGLASDIFANSLHFVAFQGTCFLCWASVLILTLPEANPWHKCW